MTERDEEYGMAARKDLVDEMATEIRLLREQVRVAREALREITVGAGPFSTDPLTHAGNCIESMKDIARVAFKQLEDKP